MKNHLFLAFRSKAFTYLWLGEIFTQIPINLLNFLLILIIFDVTKSNTAVAGIVLSFTVPAVFFGILAGVYIDRWNKKTVLLASNISRAVLLILLAIFHKNVIVIYTISFIIGIITQFFIPAESPIIPLIVEEEQLLSANALFGIGIFGSIMIAYLFSGPLLLYFGTVNTILLLAGSLFIGSILIALIKVPASEEKKGFSFNLLRIPVSAVLKEIKEVLDIIRSSKHIASSLFLLALSQILILIIAAIAPGYANDVLKIKVEQFPLVVITPATVGIMIGALALANLFHSIKKEKMVTVGLFMAAIVTIAMPFGNRLASRDFVHVINTMLPKILLISNIHIVIVLAFFLGIANAFIYVPSNTILQEKTSDEMRGKVYGVLNTVIGLFSFIPILAVGSFSDLIGVGRVVIGIGICLLFIAIAKLLLK
jgi:MFS family permease